VAAKGRAWVATIEVLIGGTYSVDRVVATYCSKDCADSADYFGKAEDRKMHSIRWPVTEKGITSYAVSLLLCDTCGANINDHLHAD